MYLTFLALFLFVITTKIPENPNEPEWALVVMASAYFIEELRQVPFGY